MVAQAVAMTFTLGPGVVLSVAQVGRHAVPGFAHEKAEKYLGLADRAAFELLIVLAGLLVCAYAGAAARRRWWEGAVILLLLAGVPAASALTGPDGGTSGLWAVGAGLAATLLVLTGVGSLLRRWERAARALADPTPPAAGPADDADEPHLAAQQRVATTRRAVLASVAGVVVVSGAAMAAGQRTGKRRRHVAASRELIRLSAMTSGLVPARARVGVEGVTPWRTRTEDLFVDHGGLQVPTIEPEDWSLRIHGLVEREVVIRYADLVAMPLTEAWVTVASVRNDVGGHRIGNPWWSGVRIADVLARAGVLPEADVVLQRSQDGWTCATPVAALTDGRQALLAVGINGEPLPLQHGFPVRTVVPGLNVHVSSCPWVVEFEVTRSDRVESSAVAQGWQAVSPIPLASRIDVPADGATVPVGGLAVAGMAWASGRGVAAVEVSLDGGDWRRARVARPGVVDTWQQWATEVQVAPGRHELRVRAVDGEGERQSGVPVDAKPGPARGWHTVRFTAEDD